MLFSLSFHMTSIRRPMNSCDWSVTRVTMPRTVSDIAGKSSLRPQILNVMSHNPWGFNLDAMNSANMVKVYTKDLKWRVVFHRCILWQTAKKKNYTKASCECRMGYKDDEGIQRNNEFEIGAQVWSFRTFVVYLYKYHKLL